MAKKRFITIPKVVSIKCIHCGKTSKRNFPEDSSPQVFECDKCGQIMKTPISGCCVICSYTNKKCPYSIKMEAKIKGLQIRDSN